METFTPLEPQQRPPFWDPRVAQHLLDVLGETMVSLLADEQDRDAPVRWATEMPHGEVPAEHQIRRLNFAREQWNLIADGEGEPVARLWFISNNSVVGEPPMDAIRKDRFGPVGDAARAVVSSQFS